MPRLPHGELVDPDPDIERTFRRRRRERKASQASTSSTMDEDNVFSLEGPNGRNQRPIQPPPHVPPPEIQEQGPLNHDGNPSNGLLGNPPPPFNNRPIEDEEQHIFRVANS